MINLAYSRLVILGYNPREATISPSKPINRPLKIELYNETAYIR